MLALVWLADVLHLLPGTDATANSTNVSVTLGSPVASGTSTGSNPAAGGVIAKISDVPTNSAFSFTLPSNSDPGVLIHLSNGQFVAYNATCTHAGCLVDFDPASHNLVCPCHGASFDPARSAAVLTGPAQTPLTSVPVKINQSADTVSLGE